MNFITDLLPCPICGKHVLVTQWDKSNIYYRCVIGCQTDFKFKELAIKNIKVTFPRWIPAVTWNIHVLNKYHNMSIKDATNLVML